MINIFGICDLIFIWFLVLVIWYFINFAPLYNEEF
jgi:hypothetical protein